MCPDLPGQIVTAMVRHYLREHRARRRRRTFPGPSLHPYIAADLRAPILGGEREPGAGLPRMQGPCPVVQRQPGARCPARLDGRLAGASADAASKVCT